mmetsp:Transcript_39678/g.60788  ORF Transcript_39678/g.60788 Transcript_39678/m.60788 type:complete len:90 (+) Transcript_39678:1542-1811(+)
MRGDKKGHQAMLEEGYSLLDNLEKEFCISNDVSPNDYHKVKQKIFFEQAKNTAISRKLLREKGREVSDIKTQTADIIFDFLVKDTKQQN